jgi:hypothetical protein
MLWWWCGDVALSMLPRVVVVVVVVVVVMVEVVDELVVMGDLLMLNMIKSHRAEKKPRH